MLLRLTCRAPNAPEIGYPLAKHPSSVFEREFSAGTVWVFYSEVADDHLLSHRDARGGIVSAVRGAAAYAGP